MRSLVGTPRVDNHGGGTSELGIAVEARVNPQDIRVYKP